MSNAIEFSLITKNERRVSETKKIKVFINENGYFGLI